MGSISFPPSMTWSVWQLVDSILPTGGFAHSFGLEAAVQRGVVAHNGNGFVAFARGVMEQTASANLPIVFAGYHQKSLEDWMEVDRFASAVMINHVTRRASVAQGSALLRVVAQTFPEVQILKKMKRTIAADEEILGHHAAVFGVLCGSLGIPAVTCQRMYMFCTLRDLMSAATRLNIVGPIQSALIQRSLGSVAEECLQIYKNRPIEDSHQSHPLVDLLQATHDTLYTRIFNS